MSTTTTQRTMENWITAGDRLKGLATDWSVISGAVHSLLPKSLPPVRKAGKVSDLLFAARDRLESQFYREQRKVRNGSPLSWGVYWVDGVRYEPTMRWRHYSRLHMVDPKSFRCRYKQRRPTQEQYLLLAVYINQFRDDLWLAVQLASRMFGVSNSAYKALCRAHQTALEVRSGLEDLYCREHRVDYRDSPFSEKRAEAILQAFEDDEDRSQGLFPPFL